MKVFSPQENYKLKKITLAAKIYRRKLEIEKVQFEPKVSKSFKEVYPQYTLPLLETQNGKFICGTNAILLYLAGQQNLKSTNQKAKIYSQLQKVEREIESATGVLVLHSKGYQSITEAQLEKSKQLISKYLKQQNEKLTFKTFLAGDRLTVADISSYANLWAVRGFFQKELDKLKNLGRWVTHLESLDAV